jgi:hypothetical protein
MLSFVTEPPVSFENEPGRLHIAVMATVKKKENFAFAENFTQENSIYDPVALLTILLSSPFPKQRLGQNISWAKDHYN